MCVIEGGWESLILPFQRREKQVEEGTLVGRGGV
jgi:hypothetical protein